MPRAGRQRRVAAHAIERRPRGQTVLHPAKRFPFTADIYCKLLKESNPTNLPVPPKVQLLPPSTDIKDARAQALEQLAKQATKEDPIAEGNAVHCYWLTELTGGGSQCKDLYDAAIRKGTGLQDLAIQTDPINQPTLLRESEPYLAQDNPLGKTWTWKHWSITVRLVAVRPLHPMVVISHNATSRWEWEKGAPSDKVQGVEAMLQQNDEDFFLKMPKQCALPDSALCNKTLVDVRHTLRDASTVLELGKKLNNGEGFHAKLRAHSKQMKAKSTRHNHTKRSKLTVFVNDHGLKVDDKVLVERLYCPAVSGLCVLHGVYTIRKKVPSGPPCLPLPAAEHTLPLKTNLVQEQEGSRPITVPPPTPVRNSTNTSPGFINVLQVPGGLAGGPPFSPFLHGPSSLSPAQFPLPYQQYQHHITQPANGSVAAPFAQRIPQLASPPLNHATTLGLDNLLQYLVPELSTRFRQLEHQLQQLSEAVGHPYDPTGQLQLASDPFGFTGSHSSGGSMMCCPAQPPASVTAILPDHVAHAAQLHTLDSGAPNPHLATPVVGGSTPGSARWHASPQLTPNDFFNLASIPDHTSPDAAQSGSSLSDSVFGDWDPLSIFE